MSPANSEATNGHPGRDPVLRSKIVIDQGPSKNNAREWRVRVGDCAGGLGPVGQFRRDPGFCGGFDGWR